MLVRFYQLVWPRLISIPVPTNETTLYTHTDENPSIHIHLEIHMHKCIHRYSVKTPPAHKPDRFHFLKHNICIIWLHLYLRFLILVQICAVTWFYLLMFYTFGQASNGSCIILVSTDFKSTGAFVAPTRLFATYILDRSHFYFWHTPGAGPVFENDVCFYIHKGLLHVRYDTNSCKVSCRSRSPFLETHFCFECSEMSVCCLQLTALAVNLLDHPVQSVPSVTVVQVIWKSFWMLSQTHILRTFTL